VETLYLHVDRWNEAAVALYAKCGFVEADPMVAAHLMFTKALDLHDRSRGKVHVLLYKDLEEATLLDPKEEEDEEEDLGEQEQEAGTMGFDFS